MEKLKGRLTGKQQYACGPIVWCLLITAYVSNKINIFTTGNTENLSTCYQHNKNSFNIIVLM